MPRALRGDALDAMMPEAPVGLDPRDVQAARSLLRRQGNTIPPVDYAGLLHDPKSLVEWARRHRHEPGMPAKHAREVLRRQ